MPVHHENRNGKDRRKFDLSSVTKLVRERRWNKDRRRSIAGEDELDDSEWDMPETDIEREADLALGD
ncbi:MAG: hypothetical protein QMB52_11440 [Propionivibrio sp.]